jgi:predicted enzyme related to lactoylglutathione lyase
MANSVGWFEVVGKDGEALRSFYGKLFDWQIAPSGGEQDYGLVQAANGGISGGIGASPDGGPGHVTFYVEVDDPAAYLARAEELGGKTVAPPMDIPGFNLTIAMVADPEGHVIGLMKSGA